jgi:hypothetical protein
VPARLILTPTAEKGRNSWPQMFRFWVVIFVIGIQKQSTTNKKL